MARNNDMHDPSLNDETSPHILDLPKIYQKPSAASLQQAIKSLSASPSTSTNTSNPFFNHISTPSSTRDAASYLTRIIASPLDWLASDEAREAVWSEASTSLSQLSGRSAASNLTRSFTIPLDASGANISIELHEPALTEDNLGLKTWSSSYVLAKQLHRLQTFLSTPADNPTGSTHSFSILELGAGTGLAGLAAAMVWRVPVILTDLEAIEPNLARNVQANAAALQDRRMAAATSGVLDWTRPERLTVRQYDSEDERLFHERRADVIIVADPIYSPEHPRLLVGAVSYWLARVEGARLVLAYPIREAYEPQIRELVALLEDIGLQKLEDHKHTDRDDWAEEVLHSLTVWAWK